MSSEEILNRLQQALGAAYTVERELGGGGMSRVFVADEAALGRKVVIKVLRPELAEGLSADRFKREVRLAARLQHPHIVPLLAGGALDGGVLYYTMPLVEGHSLRDRMMLEGALPIADAVRILGDVSSALASAHRAGIVHRDIKPENILLSEGGAVVADFGIAKAISASLKSDDGDGDALRASTLTATGTSLGTPAYMAPEQAAGDVVNHRADLYALGVVAYEMIAGSALFEGRTAQQLLAAHAIQAPEPLARRRSATPPALSSLVMRLLEKNPADRPQSADEVLRALREVTDGATHSHEVASRDDAPTSGVDWRRRHVSALVIGGAALALAGAAVGAWLARRGSQPVAMQSVVSGIVAPAGQEIRPEGGVALTPDGQRLALVAADRQGATGVWVRRLDSLSATRIDGTDGGSGPFWSPDGGSLGFFAGGQLRVADLRGGTRRALCPAPRPGGGTWTKGGTIVYTPDFLGVPLFKVAAAGGSCTQVTRFRIDEYIHRRPSALPDGRHVLFSGMTGGNATSIVDLESGAISDLLTAGGGSDAVFVPPDWVLSRDAAGGALSAQRVDLRTLRPVGEAKVVLDRVVGIRSVPSYTAGPNAIVALQASGEARYVVWVDRQSAIVDSVRAPTDFTNPLFGAATAALSHDGRRIAFAAGGPLWIHDRDRRVATKVDAQKPGQGTLDPAWDPGDSLIAYRTLYAGTLDLRVYHVGKGTSDSLFARGRRNTRTPAWSPDGQRLAFQLSAGDSAPLDEIWIYSFAARTATRAWPAAGNASSPRWSPNGAWIAYVSDELGAPEVFVRAVATSGVPVRVSTAGGEFPRWSANGRELYYRAPNGSIMAVRVALGRTATLSTPTAVVIGPPFSRAARWFEITPEGDRFFAFGREDPPVLTLLLGWQARLGAR